MKSFRTIIFAVAVMASVTAVAQLSMSPYSRYGYGLLNDNATSAQRAMGGVGYAMNSGRQINVMNPASYAWCDSLTFLYDIGMDVTRLWSKDSGASGKNFGGGLDYMTMQFPVTRWLGGSVGLLPYSSVGYSFGSDIDNGSVSSSGSGGLNQLYLGFGAKPFKGLSLGFNASYLFGTTTNDIYAITDAGSTSLFERVIQVRDYHLQFGAQYSTQLSRKNRVTVGLTYSPGKTLLGHMWGVYYDVDNDSKPDTVGYTSLNGKCSLPATYGAGVAYEWNKRLLVEVDFTYQPWSDVKYQAIEGFESSKFDNRWKLAAGLQWQPNPRGNYWRRVQYRCGAYYNHDYLNVSGNNVREWGAALGFGFPVTANKTVVSLGFEYKHRQAHPDPLVKEQYFNITVGVNFNEMWFWRNKIR